MSVIEGCDGARASWQQIHDYIVAISARQVPAYCYLIAPRGLEANTRRLIRELAAEELFTVLGRGDPLPDDCHQVVILEPAPTASLWRRFARRLSPARALC